MKIREKTEPMIPLWEEEREGGGGGGGGRERERERERERGIDKKIIIIINFVTHRIVMQYIHLGNNILSGNTNCIYTWQVLHTV